MFIYIYMLITLSFQEKENTRKIKDNKINKHLLYYFMSIILQMLLNKI